MNIEQNSACGFSSINVLVDLPKDGLQLLMDRFERFGEVIGKASDPFSFMHQGTLTICNEMAIPTEDGFANIKVTAQSTEADIAFLWGAMASRESDHLAKQILYTVTAAADAIPILNRRWGMIEQAIESMLEGIVKSAEEHKPSKESLKKLKEIIGEISKSKTNGEAMMTSRPPEVVIRMLSNAYSDAAHENLHEDSANAITGLLSMRAECMDWMLDTHRHQKTLTSPSDYLFRIAESERLIGEDIEHVLDFAFGGLMSYRISKETGSASTFGGRFLPTDQEYAVLKPKMDEALSHFLGKDASSTNKDTEKNTARRIR